MRRKEREGKRKERKERKGSNTIFAREIGKKERKVNGCRILK